MKTQRKICGCANCREREHAEEMDAMYALNRKYWAIIEFNFPDHRGKEDGA